MGIQPAWSSHEVLRETRKKKLYVVSKPGKDWQRVSVKHFSLGFMVRYRYSICLLLWESFWRCAQKFRLLVGVTKTVSLQFCVIIGLWQVISMLSPYNSFTLYAPKILNYFYITNYNLLFLFFYIVHLIISIHCLGYFCSFLWQTLNVFFESSS